MRPDVLAEYALALGYVTGCCRGSRNHWPCAASGNLQATGLTKSSEVGRHRPCGPAGLLVVANVQIAVKGSSVQDLAFDTWYYWLRLLLQLIFIFWVLFVAGVLWHNKER